jgi:hypothetical protein
MRLVPPRTYCFSYKHRVTVDIGVEMHDHYFCWTSSKIIKFRHILVEHSRMKCHENPFIVLEFLHADRQVNRHGDANLLRMRQKWSIDSRRKLKELITFNVALLPWRWRQQLSPKCWYMIIKLHGAIFQKTIILILLRSSHTTYVALSPFVYVDVTSICGRACVPEWRQQLYGPRAARGLSRTVKGNLISLPDISTKLWKYTVCILRRRNFSLQGWKVTEGGEIWLVKDDEYGGRRPGAVERTLL